MKPLSQHVIIAILSLLFPLILPAQGIYEQLADVSEETIFRTYNEDGTTNSHSLDYRYSVVWQYNMHGKRSTFHMKLHDNPRDKVHLAHPDHYTQPAIIFNNSEQEGLVVIDGLIYRLRNIKSNFSSFDIASIYLAKTKKAKGKKKKLSLKEKLANAKKALASGGVPAELRDKDHRQIITDYFKKMKVVQDEATKNFSPAIKQEIAEIKAAQMAEDAEIQRANAEFWASEHGQRVLNRSKKPKVTIKNDLGSGFGLYWGSGAYTWLAPGATETFTCHNGDIHRGAPKGGSFSGDIYNGQLERKEVLVNLDGQYCGQTLLISQLR